MNKKIYYFLITCVVFGLFFRFLNLRYNTQFTWDQENSISYPAKDILVEHHFPLIGAKTGVGDLYLTPYYSYLMAAFFALFRLDPIAGAFSASFISFITIIASFVLIKKILGFDKALFFTLLWCISPVLLQIDRIPWNVNVLPISVVLILYGLWKREKKSFFYIFSGLFLGLTAHMSILFFYALIFCLSIFSKKKDMRLFLLTVSTFILAILPLIIFNFRHENILFKNIILLVSNQSSSIGAIGNRLLQVVLLEFEAIGTLIIPEVSSWFVQLVGFLFLVLIVLNRRVKDIYHFSNIFIPLFIVYSIGFVLYRGALPQYYFLGLMVVALLGWAILVFQLAKYYINTYLILCIISVVFLSQSYFQILKTNSNSIGVKSDVIKTIKENANGNEMKMVFDMDLGWSFGYRYLADYYNLNYSPESLNSSIYWISYPSSKYPGYADFIYHNIALGLPESVNRIFSTKEKNFYESLFYMRIPKEWAVISCPSQDFDSYLLSSDLNTSCITRKSEMTIQNVPNCSIEKFSGNSKIELKNGIVFWEDTQNDENGFKDNSWFTSFEKDRCMIFSSKNNNEYLNILESIRQSTYAH